MNHLTKEVPSHRQGIVRNFVHSLYKLYVDLNFTYMEINPLVVVGETVSVEMRTSRARARVRMRIRAGRLVSSHLQTAGAAFL